MPSTNSVKLILNTNSENQEVTVKVTYNAVFSPFERFLAANGLKFKERIEVTGWDPSLYQTLHKFPPATLPVTGGTTSQTIARDRSIKVPRATLQEDPASGDADEIRCLIQIDPVGIPVHIAAITAEQQLLG